MIPLWEPSLPAGQCGHKYDIWDAAYVLGSLSASDRREFELHLAECAGCREAVADLSGMPALLSHLDHEALVSFDEADGTAEEPTLPAQLLPSLLATLRGRRRRARLAWVATAAAAAVLAIGVFAGVADRWQPPGPHPQAQVAAPLPMAQVHTALLTSTVSLSNENWGTLIALSCVCLAPSDAPQDTLAMVVVGRDGNRSRLASWVAHPGHTATPTASTSMPTDQIASVQVVSADNGQVLLQRTL